MTQGRLALGSWAEVMARRGCLRSCPRGRRASFFSPGKVVSPPAAVQDSGLSGPPPQLRPPPVRSAFPLPRQNWSSSSSDFNTASFTSPFSLLLEPDGDLLNPDTYHFGEKNGN